MKATRGKLGNIIPRIGDLGELCAISPAYAFTYLALGRPGMRVLRGPPGSRRGKDTSCLQLHPRVGCPRGLRGIHSMRDQHLDAKHRQALLQEEDIGAQPVRGCLLQRDFVERNVGQGQPRLSRASPMAVHVLGMWETGAGNQHPGRTRAFPVEALPEELSDPVLDSLVEGCFRGTKAMTFMREMG